jgi:putative ABC transport system permease protein
MTTQWIKIRRDIAASRGRLGMMVCALVVSLASVVTMLTTYTVLRREVPRSYIESHPASAQLELATAIDDTLLAAVRAVPGIAMAERASTLGTRLVLPGGERLPMLLFVVPDLTTLRINTLHPESGAWPATPGTIQIERSALALTQAAVGDTITIELSPAVRRRLVVGATVHDPGVAPAWQEQAAYGYVSSATLASIGVPVQLNRLKLIVTDSLADAARIAHTARDVAVWLTSRGIAVREVQVPPPRQHPHQAQMNAVISMLLMFSLLGLVLGAVLSAGVINGLMAEQVRQIAIMKAIGARSRQIATLYLTLVAALGVGASMIGLPLGLLAGRRLIDAVAQLLNLRLVSLSVPWWVYATALLLGTMAPVLAAMIPIIMAARRTVRSALDDHGVRSLGSEGRGAAHWLRHVRLPSPALTLAGRNLFRRRGRLTMTLLQLAGAGALCVASLDLKAAWQRTVDDSRRDRHFELELRFSRPAPWAVVREQLARVSGVRWSEPWPVVRASIGDEAEADVTHRYADGGHGAIALRAVPPAQRAIAHRMESGRWLTRDDSTAVVLNTMARSIAARAVRPGDSISLRVGDIVVQREIVGIVRQPLTGGSAFVTPMAFAEVAGQFDSTNAVRIHLAPQTNATTTAALLTTALAASGIAVTGATTEARVAGTQGGHIYILVFALVVLAMMMAIVGLIGLASSLGVSVLERTREFGVMRAVGSSSAAILTTILAEGVLVALLSGGLAIGLSRLIAGVIGRVLASISNQELQLQLTALSVAMWFALLIGGALIVSYFPAARATRLTVRDTLSHI